MDLTVLLLTLNECENLKLLLGELTAVLRRKEIRYEIIVVDGGSTDGTPEEAARQEGFETLSTMVTSRSKHGMIPGVKPWILKLIFDRSTQRVIGGQILSDSEAAVKEIGIVGAVAYFLSRHPPSRG